MTGNLIVELAVLAMLVRQARRWLLRSPRVPGWMVRDVTFPIPDGFRVIPARPYDWRTDGD